MKPSTSISSANVGATKSISSSPSSSSSSSTVEGYAKSMSGTTRGFSKTVTATTKGSKTATATAYVASNSSKSKSNKADHTSPTNSNSNSTKSDKTNCQPRSYIGINANSVKCIWDQHDNGDIDLHQNVLPILAEDASYKLWEVINNLKTFSRHSGGKLTTDIVSELLKDSNVPPVIGARAGNSEWSRMDCDGVYYYHTDEIIDLRDEYLKEITSIQCGPLTLESNWVSNQRNFKDLTKLWKSIVLAILLGDDAAFQYTIHTTLINPFIGCILPYLVQKTIEYLAFGCTDDTLDRLLCFLKVIVQNYHSRDVANNEEYFNLCNIFVCLLLGSIDMKSKLAFIKHDRAQAENDEKEINVMTSTHLKEIKTEYSSGRDVFDDDLMGVDRVIKIKDEADFSHDIYSKYVVNPIALSIKKEATDDQRFYDFENGTINTENIKYEGYNMDFQDDMMYDASKTNDIKSETHHGADRYMNGRIDAPGASSSSGSSDEIFSPFVTDACDDRFVDDVCTLIGYLAGKWGYFEHEITYLLSKRLEIFFYEERNNWSKDDFKWLRRIIQALAALGETAFRELTLYFEYIPYEQFPEWLISYINYGAIYIRGRKDYFFYEYMDEVCGDSLQPFLMYYAKYIKKMLNRTLVLRKKQKQSPLKIGTKYLLASMDRPKSSETATATVTTTITTATTASMTTKKPIISMDDMFPDRTPLIRKLAPTTRRIGFKFAGCCPVLAKPNLKLTSEQQFVQSIDLCNKLNKRILICRRKLLKPIYINDYPTISHLIDNRQYNI